MKKRVAFASLILAISVGVLSLQPRSRITAQTQPSAAEEKKAAEINTFVTYAQSVPPEFSAALLIDLVESGQIKDKKRQQELLVESFYNAAKAKQPVKLVAMPGSAVDSRSGYKATASRAGLDALSLQSRAIKTLLRLNKKRARQLFGEIKLNLEPIDCRDALAYEVNSFYTTIQALAPAAFSAEEIRRGEHVYFVENYVTKMNSPVQVQPVVKLLLSLNTTDLELASLGRTFSSALQKVPADYRSFTAPWNSLRGSIDELLTRFNQRGLSSDEIIEAYRTYLVTQLSGPRCGDTGRNPRQQEIENSLITYFNETLRQSTYKKTAAISEEDIKPGKPDVSPVDESYWTSPKAKNILMRIKKLRFSEAGKEFRAEEKQSSEWQSMLSEFIRDLSLWNAGNEKTEEDYFHQKSVIYYSLLQIIPKDAQYEGVLGEALRDFASMLSSSPLQKEKPSEWFLHAKVLIDLVNKSQPAEHDKLVNLINSSRSPVLQLYVQKQQLFSHKEAPNAH